MSTKNGFRTTLLILILCLPALAFAENRWEYSVKTFPILGDDQALTQAFNQQGLLGWELVNCTEGDAQLTCVFKRLLGVE